MKPVYKWIEFKPRPKKDGLHDSGYRHIRLTGVQMDEDTRELTRTDLNQWSDHVLLFGAVNIDVQEDGTIRLMDWSRGAWTHDGRLGSDATFEPSNWDKAVSLVQTYADMAKEKQ